MIKKVPKDLQFHLKNPWKIHRVVAWAWYHLNWFNTGIASLLDEWLLIYTPVYMWDLNESPHIVCKTIKVDFNATFRVWTVCWLPELLWQVKSQKCPWYFYWFFCLFSLIDLSYFSLSRDETPVVNFPGEEVLLVFFISLIKTNDSTSRLCLKLQYSIGIYEALMPCQVMLLANNLFFVNESKKPGLPTGNQPDLWENWFQCSGTNTAGGIPSESSLSYPVKHERFLTSQLYAKSKTNSHPHQAQPKHEW